MEQATPAIDWHLIAICAVGVMVFMIGMLVSVLAWIGKETLREFKTHIGDDNRRFETLTTQIHDNHAELLRVVPRRSGERT